ncbi:MAG: polyprenyl synthetase family protein [Allobaculum sp.]|nr:polyprenyl synthetase family protein [Allobaculum sp.]
MDTQTERLNELKEEFEAQLMYGLASIAPSRLKEAMSYSLLAPGKRIRPLLLFAALEAYGVDPHLGFPMGSAIEMIHTYSLIHDDMPEMDDDDLRRGRPTCHKQFGVDAALLAGDALQSLAFETLCQTQDVSKIPALVQLTAQMAGANGMCYGQDLDLQATRQASLSELIAIESRKTGCLIALPLASAAILAGHEEDVPTWIALGNLIGIQFQIQDDLLEVLSDVEAMGKSLSDNRNEKATMLSLFTVEEGQEQVLQYDQRIQSTLDQLGLEDGLLRTLIHQLKTRTH